jgi:uncharacterized membrane protein (UPF0136 family)
MKTSEVVLWVYVGLLAVGGLIGFFKAGSKVSLMMSAAFALLLVLCILKVLPLPWLAEILLGVLLAVFAMRLFKTGNFMPSGLMLAVTACALVLRLWLR